MRGAANRHRAFEGFNRPRVANNPPVFTEIGLVILGLILAQVDLSVEITLDCGYNVSTVWSADRGRMHDAERLLPFIAESEESKREVGYRFDPQR
jgi:hypothetical protein